MKRCPKCNRNYPTNTQRFCTHDGGMLMPVDVPTGEIPEAERQSADAPTKVISRDLPSEDTVQFDPFKTRIDVPPERTSEVRGRDTRDLAPQMPAPQVQPTSAPLPPPPSGPISESLSEVTMLSMPKEVVQPPPEQPVSAPLPAPGSREVSAPPAATEAPVSSGALPQTGSGPVSTSAPLPSPGQTSGSLPPQDSGPISTSASLTPPAASSGSLPSPEFSSEVKGWQVQPLAPPAAPRKKSRAPLIMAILAVLFILVVALGVGAYFVIPKILPMIQARRSGKAAPAAQNPNQSAPVVESSPGQTAKSTNENASPAAAKNEPPPYQPPADAVQFVNTNKNLDGKLAEHYVDFSFYFPERWVKDPKSGVAGASNFVKVERRLPPDFTQENFAVGWYSSSGSLEADQSIFHSLAENLSAQFEKNFPEYQKVSEGSTKVGVYQGYEFRFEGLSKNTTKGDIKLWGRVIFLPARDGGKNGVTLLMLTTSLAPELRGVDDVGEKGELPMILESFRFGRPASP